LEIDSLEPYFRVDHWELLGTLLQHLASKSSRSFSLKLSFQPAISAALLDSLELLKNDHDHSRTYCLKLVTNVSTCYQLLTDQLNDVARLTADQHMSLLSDSFEAARNSLELLILLQTENAQNVLSTQLVNEYCSSLIHVITVYQSLQVGHSQPKKVCML
jgi:hypothetical protein